MLRWTPGWSEVVVGWTDADGAAARVPLRVAAPVSRALGRTSWPQEFDLPAPARRRRD
jgi:hypothetical protein